MRIENWTPAPILKTTMESRIQFISFEIGFSVCVEVVTLGKNWSERSMNATGWRSGTRQFVLYEQDQTA
jgi:hypothetical protein